MSKLLSNPVFWGAIATLLVCITALYLGASEVCNETNACLSRIDVFLNSNPNELGDTLAGFAGTLAFVWIIVTVLLQSRELAAQREELSLTRSEMKAQRQASEDMARSMSAQAKIFEQEALERKQDAVSKTVDQMIWKFQEEITTANPVWIERDDGMTTPRHFCVPWSSDRYGTISQETFFRDLLRSIDECQVIVSWLVEADKILEKPAAKTLRPSLETLEDLLSATSELSEAQQVRIQRLKLRDVNGALVALDEAPIWGNS